MKAMIVENLSKGFNLGKSNEFYALKNISISIDKGECVLLKGPSGSGKTTLLTLLSCLSKPTSGSYTCMDVQVSKWSEKFLTRFRKEHIGVIFQHFNLITGFSTAYNIALPLIPLGLSTKALDEKVKEAAEKVNIAHKLDTHVDRLSGGELQRVAIARALISAPEILFADEPTAHLDSKNAQEVLSIFEQLKEEGKTILITTHDPLVEEHGIIDRTILMKDGVIV
ncbi:ABC transporter ATP-binding protein [Algivirga pacifica]|uniref:ABC transporter ATP-binding protein n=1 Tax=Algivirga pacifica TaxID=1162670 RepID=A0ABP9DA49_9BACT